MQLQRSGLDGGPASALQRAFAPGRPHRRSVWFGLVCLWCARGEPGPAHPAQPGYPAHQRRRPAPSSAVRQDLAEGEPRSGALDGRRAGEATRVGVGGGASGPRYARRRGEMANLARAKRRAYSRLKRLPRARDWRERSYRLCRGSPTLSDQGAASWRRVAGRERRRRQSEWRDARRSGRSAETAPREAAGAPWVAEPRAGAIAREVAEAVRGAWHREGQGRRRGRPLAAARSRRRRRAKRAALDDCGEGLHAVIVLAGVKLTVARSLSGTPVRCWSP